MGLVVTMMSGNCGDGRGRGDGSRHGLGESSLVSHRRYPLIVNGD
jgi:hypothetical protein